MLARPQVSFIPSTASRGTKFAMPQTQSWRRISTYLKQYSTRLKQRHTRQPGRGTTHLDSHQEALIDLAGNASDIADQTLYIWSDLKPQDGQSMLQSFKKACLSMKRDSQLGRLQGQFMACRDKIQFHLIAYLSTNVDQLTELSTNIYERQGHLDQGLQQTRDEIMTILKINDRKFMGAIMELKGGRTLAIKNMPCSASDGAYASDDDDTVHSSLTEFQSGPTKGRQASMARNFQQIVDLISESLCFERLPERRNAIQEAHVATFNWIFTLNGPVADTKAFASFPEWLERGRGCYWIAGKAGSGKSTLMKKIIESPMTEHHLRVWCGQRELFLSSFFFWYLGSTLQKSREGMLRSLLFALLEQTPQTVLSAMPELLIEASRLRLGDRLAQPSLSQLQRWFKGFAKLCESSHNIRVCFFIDGLDEYPGDKFELAGWLIKLSSQTQAIKFVLASRPLSAFTARFEKLPGLRVQDLTSSDTEEYTRSLLEIGPAVVGTQQLNKLIRTISQRSQGVFLWVVVVVKSVLEGLCDGDTVCELQERVEELPTELRDLYQRMLESIGDKYQSDAAQMLLLAATAFGSTHQAYDTGTIDPFPAIQLSFAIDGCTAAMRAPVQSCAEDEVCRRTDALKKRLRSRCLGLLELRDRSDDVSAPLGLRRASAGRRLLSMVIEPFHRTAVEFILDEDVYTLLVSLAGDAYDPFQALFCSIIRMAKIAPCFFPDSALGATAAELPPWYHIYETLFLSVDAWERGNGINQEYMNEFDRVMDFHWSKWAKHHAPAQHQNSTWFSIVVCNRQTAQGDWIPKDGDDQELATLMLDDRLCARILERYQEIGYTRILALTIWPDQIRALLSGPPLDREASTLLLQVLLQTEFSFSRVWFRPEAAVALDAILAVGADPNAMGRRQENRRTLWEDFFLDLHAFLRTSTTAADSKHGGEVLFSMVRAFVDHGADLFVVIPVGAQSFRPSRYMRLQHEQTLNHLSKPKVEGLVDLKFQQLVDGMGAAADLLAAREEQAGVNSRAVRAAHRLRGSPARSFKKWISRSRASG